MHLRPGEVRLDKAERRVPEALAENTHVRFGGSVSFGWSSDDFYDDGYLYLATESGRISRIVPVEQ